MFDTMQIDHDPNEHRKFPDYGERKWATDTHGREATPSDLIRFLLPIAAVSIALFLWRTGWPF